MSYQVLPEIFLPQLVKNLVLLFGQAGLGKAQVFVQVDPDSFEMIIQDVWGFLSLMIAVLSRDDHHIGLYDIKHDISVCHTCCMLNIQQCCPKTEAFRF